MNNTSKLTRWSCEELHWEEKRFGVHDARVTSARAEIDRRRVKRKRRRLGIAIAAAVIVAIPIVLILIHSSRRAVSFGGRTSAGSLENSPSAGAPHS
jgi:hypothetical protein